MPEHQVWPTCDKASQTACFVIKSSPQDRSMIEEMLKATKMDKLGMKSQLANFTPNLNNISFAHGSLGITNDLMTTSQITTTMCDADTASSSPSPSHMAAVNKLQTQTTDHQNKTNKLESEVKDMKNHINSIISGMAEKDNFVDKLVTDLKEVKNKCNKSLQVIHQQNNVPCEHEERIFQKEKSMIEKDAQIDELRKQCDNTLNEETVEEIMEEPKVIVPDEPLIHQQQEENLVKNEAHMENTEEQDEAAQAAANKETIELLQICKTTNEALIKNMENNQMKRSKFLATIANPELSNNNKNKQVTNNNDDSDSESVDLTTMSTNKTTKGRHWKKVRVPPKPTKKAKDYEPWHCVTTHTPWLEEPKHDNNTCKANCKGRHQKQVRMKPK